MPDFHHVLVTVSNNGQQLPAPPPRQSGISPQWLPESSVALVIGGMGRRAQQLFKGNNSDVLAGASENTPEELVAPYLTDELQCRQNICDH